VKILLFGSSGQIGWHLARLLPELGAVEAPGRSAVDFSCGDSVRAAVRAARPELIVNAAAYTEVDRAEAESALAYAVNADAPAIMAEEARACDALLVHYSTAYVFDGTAAPYVETDAPNPINEYGRSKLAGEAAILRSGARHLVFRTNWVYDVRRKNFATMLVELARTRDELRVVDDQVGQPTWAGAIARATVDALRALSNAPAAGGVYNLCAPGSATRFDFAEALFPALRESTGASLPTLHRAATVEFPAPARRPFDTRLEMTRFTRDFAIRLSDWRAQLDAFSRFYRDTLRGAREPVDTSR
jgi:dTDP-4-dehydrorhamnose reductase